SHTRSRTEADALAGDDEVGTTPNLATFRAFPWTLRFRGWSRMKAEGEWLLRQLVTETQRNFRCRGFDRLPFCCDGALARGHCPIAFEDSATYLDLVNHRRERDSDRLKIDSAHAGIWRSG